MDASELTRRRRARTLYTNNIYRQNAIASGIITNKPATSGNQIGDKNGVDYNEWKNYITVGPTTISRAELDVIFAEPVPPPPTPTFNETFAVFVKQTSTPNWLYRVYNSTTNLWSALIDTGYPHATWAYYGVSFKTNYFCVALQNTGTTGIDFLFVDSLGQLIKTISMPDDNNVYEFSRNYFFIRDGTTVQIYNPLTQVLQSAALAIDYSTYLDNGVFLQGPQVDGNASYYMWPLGSTAAPVLIVNHIVGRGKFGDYDEHNDIKILITCSGATYLDTVYLIFSNGTFTSYNLYPPNVYTDVNTAFYGINNKFTLLNLTAEDNSVTYHRFPNVLGTITPDIITLTDPNFNTEYYISNYDSNPTPSYQSNHLVITNYAPNTNVSCILTGGTSLLFGDGGGGGNFIQLAAGQVVYDPELRIQPDFIITNGIYGSQKKYTDQSGRFAGYVVGSDISGNPHTSLVYTQSGLAQLGVIGTYAYDASGATHNRGEYDALNNITGRWWSYQRSSNGPTICELWFTMENTNWPTISGEVFDAGGSAFDLGQEYNFSIDISGTNIVLGKMLLAVPHSNSIPDAMITDFLNAYVDGVASDLFTDIDDFTTIDPEAYQARHDGFAAQYVADHIKDIPGGLDGPYVYTYDQGAPQPPPQFSEGVAYVSISGENFMTLTYTAPNLLSKNIQMNESAVIIIEGYSDIDKQSSRVITYTLPGTVVDLSGNLPINPYPILDLLPLLTGVPNIIATQMQFTYLHTDSFISSSLANFFPVGTTYFVIDNSNDVLYHELFSSSFIFPFFGYQSSVFGGQSSGGNLVLPAFIIQSILGISDLTQPDYLFFLRNSILTKYADFKINYFLFPPLDNASGVMFAYGDNTDISGNSNIVIMTNTGISGTTFELSYLDLKLYTTADHLILLAGPTLVIHIWDSTGTRYSYTPLSSIDVYSNACCVFSTSTKICFFLLTDPTEVWFYIIFDLETHTYTNSTSQNIEGVELAAHTATVNYPSSLNIPTP